MKAFAVLPVGMSLFLALTLFAAAAGAAPASGQAAQPKELLVSVEVEGFLPGFTQDQLSAYIAKQMNATDVVGWKFIAEPVANGVPAPGNRVVWHFKLLPFAGGTVKYIGPALSKARELFGVGRPVGIDAKIYLDGKYQSSNFDQIAIKNGTNDRGFDGAIRKITRTITADALSEHTFGGPKFAG